MALWPNARLMTRSTYKGFGAAPGLDSRIKKNGDRLNRFVSDYHLRNASTPDGYDMRGLVPPIVAGSMSARRPVADFAMDANLLQGAPMDGVGSFALAGGGGLSLVVSLSATAAVCTFTGDGMVLRLTVGMDGAWTSSLTGTSSLSMIVPMEASGTVAQLTGASDLRGILALEGEWTPFSELSPENLARNVWDALAAQYNNPGTMGNRLNTASAGGVDLNALAEAVWEHVNRTLTAPTDANVVRVRGQTLTGAGILGNPWRPE